MTGSAPTFSKYRLIARLGSGGMAEVYLVVAEGPSHFNKLQVLKFMRSDLPDDERADFLQMFQDEARLAARLSHPNIVQSHEVGSEEGMPFLAMEYLDGQSLGRIRQRDFTSPQKTLSLEMWLFVLCEVLEGLEYAHTLTDYDGTPLHIVHRDVSPDNVFMTYSGQIKLVDFGIAKSLESNKTRPGVVKGKVAYMAPEQVRGLEVDNRADLFSVGVMLWEVIAGRSMHNDLSVFAAVARVASGGMPSIREAAPDVPPELAQIVERALAMDREHRYPDAATFRRDLAACLEGLAKVRAQEIGERVAQAFATERTEISAIIRHAMMGGTKDCLWASFRKPRPGTLASLGIASDTPPFADAPAPDAPTTPMEPIFPQVPAAPTPLPPASNRHLKALTAMLIFGCAAALGLTATSRNRTPVPPVSAMHAAIRTTPKHAKIRLDGPLLALPKQPAARTPGPSLPEAPRPLRRTRVESKRPAEERDMYRDLPPPKSRRTRARMLDKDDPWAP